MRSGFRTERPQRARVSVFPVNPAAGREMRSMASETFLAFLDDLFGRANALLKQKKKKKKRARVTESRLMYLFFFYLSGPKFRLVSQLRQSQ